MEPNRDFKKLPLYRGNALAGHLIQDSQLNLSFAYAPGWEGGAISPRLPLDGSATPEDVRAWFQELLPGGRRWRTFGRFTRLSPQRIGEFLSWYGEDLPGELSVKPESEGNEPEDMAAAISYTVRFGDSIDSVSLGSSLGGCAPKVSVIALKTDLGISFLSPSSAWPSTHILKAPGEAAAIEHCSMKLAAALDLFPVASLEPVAIGRRPFLLIERYDRYRGNNGKVKKLPQENFCQAAGNLNRYGSEDNGLKMEDMAGIIVDRLNKASLKTFMLMSFFSMFIGNSDDHAGNYALLRNGDGIWDLAPAYDLISVASLMALEKDGYLGPWPMLKFLSLEQPRKFGNHYDAMLIDNGDIPIACGIFQFTPPEMRELAMECQRRIMECLVPAFIAGIKDDWEMLELDNDLKQLMLVSIETFFKVVRHRTAHLGKRLEKAFNQ